MRPRKRFGQHFLTDTAIIQRILDRLSPLEGQNIVEIGPGRGALTLPLLARCQRLNAVELDRDLIGWLEQTCADKGELLLHSADALTFDFASLATPKTPLRLIGNLPYNISTPLMFHLMTFCPLITDMLFMVQEEVAARLASPPGSKTYGRLSVMAQYHCKIQYAFKVPPESFTPPPKVQSAIIRMVPHAPKPYIAKDEGLLQSLVTAAFAQRRKTLRNNLSHWLTEADYTALDLSPSERAEQLSVGSFVAMANHVTQR